MKRLILGMPVLFLVGFVSGCSKDIKVISDVGEISIVKQSAVTTYPLNKDLARRKVQAALDAATESNERCSKFLEKQKCQSIYIEDVFKYNIYLEKIETMPDILMVEYRTVDTNVNGDKTASGYRYVACLPNGDTYDRPVVVRVNLTRGCSSAG